MQVLLGFLEKLDKHNPESELKSNIPLCFLLQVLFEFPSLFPLMIDGDLQDELNPILSSPCLVRVFYHKREENKTGGYTINSMTRWAMSISLHI